jgi:hypothetical protein
LKQVPGVLNRIEISTVALLENNGKRVLCQVVLHNLEGLAMELHLEVHALVVIHPEDNVILENTHLLRAIHGGLGGRMCNPACPPPPQNLTLHLDTGRMFSSLNRLLTSNTVVAGLPYDLGLHVADVAVHGLVRENDLRPIFLNSMHVLVLPEILALMSGQSLTKTWSSSKEFCNFFSMCSLFSAK